MHPAGFEPAHTNINRLERFALDRSAMDACEGSMEISLETYAKIRVVAYCQYQKN